MSDRNISLILHWTYSKLLTWAALNQRGDVWSKFRVTPTSVRALSAGYVAIDAFIQRSQLPVPEVGYPTLHKIQIVGLEVVLR